MSYIFLASPFRSIEPDVTADRIEAAVDFVQHYLDKNPAKVIFSPVVYYHMLVQKRPEVLSAYDWEALCRAFLSKASLLLVLKLPNHDTDPTIKMLKDLAASLSIPIAFAELD